MGVPLCRARGGAWVASHSVCSRWAFFACLCDWRHSLAAQPCVSFRPAVPRCARPDAGSAARRGQHAGGPVRRA
eukprot:6294801-Prymnesium_polylepis.2